MRFLLLFMLCIVPLASSHAEGFVSTIEAVQNISGGVSKEDIFHMAQGSSFTIAKGERFYSFYTCEDQKDGYGCINDDPSCVINYKGKNYDVTDCVWLMDGWARNPKDDDPFQFIETRPANSSDMLPHD